MMMISRPGPDTARTLQLGLPADACVAGQTTHLLEAFLR